MAAYSTRRRVRRAWCSYHMNDSRVDSSTEAKKPLSKNGPFSAWFQHTCSRPSDSERARGLICLTGRRFLAVAADSTRRRVRRASCLCHIHDSRVNSSTEAKTRFRKMARCRPDFNIRAEDRATPSVPEASYASRKDAFRRWRHIRRDDVCGAHRVCVI